MPPRAQSTRSVLSRQPTVEECAEFLRAHAEYVRTGQGNLINPITGRRLQNPNAERAQELLRICQGIVQAPPIQRNIPVADVHVDNVQHRPRNPGVVLRDAGLCQSLRANLYRNPITNGPMPRAEYNEWVTICARMHPLIRVTYEGREYTPQQVYRFLYEDANNRTHSSIHVRDKADFIQHLEAYFPIKWIEYYHSPGRRRLYRAPGNAMFSSRDRNLSPEYDKSSSVSNNLSIKSHTIRSDENIRETCVNTFKTITDDKSHPFRSVLLKVTRLCSYNKDKCNIKRIKDTQKEIADGYGKRRHTELRFPPMKEIPDDLSSLYNFHALTVFHNHIQSLDVTYQGEEGIGSGVTRNFINNCIDQIKRSKMFAPSYPGSTRVVVNPDTTVDSLKDSGFNVQNEKDVLDVYEFVGSFFAFCARFDVPVPIYLARSIISAILHKNTDVLPEMDIFYYLLDADPEIVKSTIQMFGVPNDIEMMFMEMNDDYPLKKVNEPITQTNFVEYLQLLSRHMFQHQIRPDAFNTNARLKAFIKGFYVKNALRRAKFTVRDFERMVCGRAITMKSINEFVNKKDHITVIAADDNELRIFKWFLEIIRGNGDDIPIDEVPMRDSDNSDSSGSSERRRKNKEKTPSPVKRRQNAFVTFFMNLVQFWTAFRKLDMESVHQVIFERDNGLPSSHTCFRQLSLPRNISSKEDLYKRLVTAVFNVERGIGLY